MSRLHDLPATIAILLRCLMGMVGPWLRKLAIAFGVISLFMAILAFTRMPFDAHRWLGTAGGDCAGEPEMIVVLGGSGMPSGPELLRLHVAAALAQDHPSSHVIVVHPGEPAVMCEMVAELTLRGVEAERIVPIREGNNTREQALIVVARMPKVGNTAIVTAPENMYRTLRAFRKAGMAQACGAPAWDHAMYHDFAYGHKSLGGRALVPDVSGQLSLRYTFWNYLKLEVTCLREYAAIGYYKLNGWI